MTEYTYRTVEALTGEPVADIGLSGVSFTRGLGGSGVFNATMSLADPKAGPDNLTEHKHEIEVFRNGQPVWVGPLVNVQPQLSSRTVTLQAAPVWWWMTRRSIELDLTWTEIDLAEVAWETISTSQGKVPNGSARIEKAAAYPVAAGQTYTGTISGFNRRYVNDVISELGQQYPGFDYDVTYQLDLATNRVKRYFNMYPGLKGVLADQTMTPANGMSDLSFTGDATQVATRVHELGAGEGPDQLIYSLNNELLTDDLIMTEEVISRTDVGDLGLLALYAQADLILHNWPARVYGATFSPNPALPWGFATYGDTVNVQAALGGWEINTEKRIISETINVGSSGSEEITLTFNEVSPV